MIRKLLFFILYHSGISVLLRRKLVKEKEIAVLLFHRISNNSDFLWPSMPIKSFEKLILKLQNTVEIFSFSDLYSLKSYPSRPIIILSFDDGYSDFYEHVMPFFKTNKIKANHNICPGLIELNALPWTQILSLYLSFKTTNNESFNNKMAIKSDDNLLNENSFINLCKELLKVDDVKRNEIILPLLNHIPKEKLYKLMNWDQIKYCVENNIEIGSHGNLHRNLLQVWDLKTLNDEINESSEKIELKLGIKPKIFAFANAMGNKESIEFVKKSSYQFILILMDKLLKWYPFSTNEVVEIPRINISRKDWREEYLRSLGFHARIKQIFKNK
jgi:peptidoglycan/xylan/chitin deacetylase (PgdA/CDA1 family)